MDVVEGLRRAPLDTVVPELRESTHCPAHGDRLPQPHRAEETFDAILWELRQLRWGIEQVLWRLDIGTRVAFLEGQVAVFLAQRKHRRKAGA